MSASTYAFDPPSIVCHRGASRTPSKPWLAKKRMKKRAGISRMRAGDDDQIAAPIGARKWSVSARP